MVMAPRKNPHHGSLKQIEYRTYQRTIELYHYPHKTLPISRFEEMFAAKTFGFIRRLESHDTLCEKNGSEKNHVPDGDEVPIGVTEVAYLFNIFRNRRSSHATGSALGFRLLDEDRIEWMCFDRPIRSLISEATTDDGVHLFEKVADLERSGESRSLKGTVQGWREHRHWCDGLQVATKPVLELTVVEESRARLDEHKARDAGHVEVQSGEDSK